MLVELGVRHGQLVGLVAAELPAGWAESHAAARHLELLAELLAAEQGKGLAGQLAAAWIRSGSAELRWDVLAGSNLLPAGLAVLDLDLAVDWPERNSGLPRDGLVIEGLAADELAAGQCFGFPGNGIAAEEHSDQLADLLTGLLVGLLIIYLLLERILSSSLRGILLRAILLGSWLRSLETWYLDLNWSLLRNRGGSLLYC